MTYFGFVIIIIAVFMSLKRLILLTTFFAPFSAFYAINFSDSEKGVLVFMILIAIIGLKLIIYHILLLKIPLYNYLTVFYVILFNLAIIISLINLFLNEGSIEIPPVDLSSPDYIITLNKFDFTNISQLVYIILGFIYVYAINVMFKNKYDIILVLKTYILSLVFTVFWGSYQYLAFIYDIQYVELFNNGLSSASQGYLQIDDGIKRISSVASEPSIYCIQLSLGMGLLIPSLKGKNNIYLFGKGYDLVIFVIFTIASLAATAFTGYISTVISLLFIVILVYKKEYIVYNFFRLLFALPFIILMSLIVYPIIILKIISYSFIERFNSINTGLELFLKSPVFGIGWGEVTSHDLIIRMLANGGILTLFTFLLLILHVIKKIFKSRYDTKDYVDIIKMRSFIGLFMILIIMSVTGFQYYFGFFWVALSIAIFSGNLYNYTNQNR